MICFCWCGFPQYGARCVGDFVKKHPEEDVVVVATRPRVPIKGMDELAGCPVYWVEGKVSLSYQVPEINPAAIRVLFVDGWSEPAFNEMRDDVRKAGGKVICMVDNNLQFHQIGRFMIPTFKEVLKSIRFRALLRKRYDGYFVPGEAGRKFFSFYGVSQSLVKTGFYSADSKVFFDGKPLDERAKEIIYVGQFCERKNVIRMVKAFMAANKNHDWRLALYGNGPLKDELLTLAKDSCDCVKINDFMQPEQLAAKYRESKVFCLTSVEEHWGLVVHEAALSGCILCLSNRIGAADDFITDANGCSFNPFNEDSIKLAFEKVMNLDSDALKAAHKMSLKVSKKASLEKFSKNAGEWL